MLVVTVAGAALVLFAVREADQERFAWRQEQNLRLEQTAALAADKTLSSLSDLVRKLSTSYRPGGSTDPVLSPSERAFAPELFVIRNDGVASFPFFHPPFRLGGPVPAVPPEDHPAISPALKAAEELEFVHNDFEKAVQAYRAVLAVAAKPSQQAKPMLGLARTLARAGRTKEALVVYRSLIREHDAERSEDGLPAGLVGRFAYAQLAVSAGQPEGAAKTLLDLRERLLDGAFDIDKSQFSSFLSLAEERFAEVLGGVGPGEGRRALETRQGMLRTRGQATLDQAERAEWIALYPGAFRRGEIAFSFLPIGSGRYLAGSTPIAGGETFGAVFDARKVGSLLVPEIVRSLALEAGLRINLFVEDTAPAASPSPSGLSVERPLAPDLPQWTVRAWLDPAGSRLPGFETRRAIYVAAALVLIGAVLAGGLITIRGMAREMEVVRLKSDFVATVSHELRTPLTSIRYISELLKAGRVADEARKAQYYATLDAESERLGRIIENILDFSKIEAGLKEYRFVSTETGPLTVDIAARFQEMVAPKGFTLVTEIVSPLPALPIDPEALERALFNLLDNAVKYSGESREVGLRTRAVAGRIRWEVVDRGIGISSEDKDRIFERFFRSRAGADPSVKGSGIGLTIAKHIIEAHGGTLSVESVVGKGSTFIVMIPIRSERTETNA
jgi:signal transduction histidine kinase